MLRIIIPVLVAFTVYCLVDALRSRSDEVRGLPRLAWLPVIVLFPLFGGLAWLIAGRPRSPGEEGPSATPRPPRVVGPDDDPDFLRRLRDVEPGGDEDGASPETENKGRSTAPHPDSEPEPDPKADDGEGGRGRAESPAATDDPAEGAAASEPDTTESTTDGDSPADDDRSGRDGRGPTS